MIQYFQEGGWPMWLVLLLTILGVIASGLGLVAGRGQVGVALGAGTLVLGLMIAGAGVFGWQLGRARTDAAVANVSPPDFAEILRDVGYEESSHALVCGLAGAALPLVAGLAGIFLALARSSRERDSPGPRGG